MSSGRPAAKIGSLVKARDPDRDPIRFEVRVEYVSVTIVGIQGALFAFDTQSTTFIAPYQQPVRVPTAPPYVVGVIHLRGRLITVVDLTHVLELKPRRPLEQSTKRILVLEANGVMFGVVVDVVIGVRDIPKDGIEKLSRTALERSRAAQPEGVVTILSADAFVSGVLAPREDA